MGPRSGDLEPLPVDSGLMSDLYNLAANHFGCHWQRPRTMLADKSPPCLPFPGAQRDTHKRGSFMYCTPGVALSAYTSSMHFFLRQETALGGHVALCFGILDNFSFKCCCELALSAGTHLEPENSTRTFTSSERWQQVRLAASSIGGDGAFAV